MIEPVLFWNWIRLIFAAAASFWIVFGYKGWTDYESSGAHLDRRFALGVISTLALIAVVRVVRVGSIWQRALGVLAAIVPGFGLYAALRQIYDRW